MIQRKRTFCTMYYAQGRRDPVKVGRATTVDNALRAVIRTIGERRFNKLVAQVTSKTGMLVATVSAHRRSRINIWRK